MYRAIQLARVEALEAEGDKAGAERLRAAIAEQDAALEADRKATSEALDMLDFEPPAPVDPRELVDQDGDGVADAMAEAWQGGA